MYLGDMQSRTYQRVVKKTATEDDLRNWYAFASTDVVNFIHNLKNHKLVQ